MAGYSSNSKIFARRGNPWVSRREGERLFGRNLETENPELDQFTRARKAEPKVPFVDPKPVPSTEPDYSRKKANILRKMRTNMNGHEPQLRKSVESPRAFKLCPGCRYAKCAATMSCQGDEIRRARRRGEVNG